MTGTVEQQKKHKLYIFLFPEKDYFSLWDVPFASSASVLWVLGILLPAPCSRVTSVAVVRAASLPGHPVGHRTAQQLWTC